MASDKIVLPDPNVASDLPQFAVGCGPVYDHNQGTGEVPFEVTMDEDVFGTAQYQSMTMQPKYHKSSFEELRTVDDTKGRRCGEAAVYPTRSQFGGFGASVWASSNAATSPKAVVDLAGDTEGSSDDEQAGTHTPPNHATNIDFGFQPINGSLSAASRPKLKPVAPKSVKSQVRPIPIPVAAAKQVANTSKSKATTVPPKLRDLTEAHNKSIRRVVAGMVKVGKPLDFGVVRRKVELDCGLDLGLLDGNPFKTLSKNVIKEAVVSFLGVQALYCAIC
ncbi:hypothetical protein LTS18_011683 [Coniosporium uncinatum]|uniref:Uncharacterized protein n=1 Tax=Coniosporium uncinatum TaxID=93489 RepID=A0ACC3CY84_9PEZI|nr:hypothetical protein LTS18_011683 [Coniosporium uncinatum]